ncbi:peptidyl-prolyl cis-trans isomerase, cyclophilin-type [Indibacter alkaliphilus LW1]|uniref:Peptidyl-prolyl cis-trans isomerase n=1 Tax=Indibacter alkaliphilus (strain CCUG 57479 / KCTC 22604 / LW1) TaxID=1189612 RepID=S2E042_INDAL|nr:peptidylprolyl isomerase [Indibacter alkaliphilus]EOZ95418.1 peptidyl-prolyl cis-trans isomerase, cyclophilin-type [Indibacter alkaliphilus LW1]
MKNLFLIIAFCTLIPLYSPAQDKIPVGLIETPLGKIFIEFSDLTPNHQESFVQLAEAGYWDSLTFNRVIPDFVAQGGCPDTPEGFNDPEYLLEPEFHPTLTHVYGAVGAGRDDNVDKLSARCQFYIVQNKNGLHRLDGDYTVFGHVIQGMEIVDQIVQVPKTEQNQPLIAITLDIKITYMTSQEIIDLKKGNT